MRFLIARDLRVGTRDPGHPDFLQPEKTLPFSSSDVQASNLMLRKIISRARDGFRPRWLGFRNQTPVWPRVRQARQRCLFEAISIDSGRSGIRSRASKRVTFESNCYEQAD